MYDYSVREYYGLTDDGQVIVTTEIEFDDGGSKKESEERISLHDAIERLAHSRHLSTLHELYQRCLFRNDDSAATIVRTLNNLSKLEVFDSSPDEYTGLFSGDAIYDAYCELDSGKYLRWNQLTCVMCIYHEQKGCWEKSTEGWLLFLNSERYRVFPQRWWFLQAAFYGRLHFTTEKPEGWSPK